VLEKKHSAKSSLPSVVFVTLGKELLRRVFYFTEGFLRGTRQRALCRVPEIKHSAKNMALGKEPNSGSVCKALVFPILHLIAIPYFPHLNSKKLKIMTNGDSIHGC
jgi:hypothetical protein